MSRRALWAFACAACGIVLARVTAVDPWWWTAAAGVALVCACVLRGRWCGVALGSALLLAFAGWCEARTSGERAAAWARAVGAEHEARIVAVEGIVVEEPERSDRPRGALARFMERERTWTARLRAERLIGEEGGVEVLGEMWMRVVGEVPRGLRAGDRVRVRGLFRGLEGPVNPGARDWRPFAAQDGRVGSIFVTDGSLVERVEGAGASLFGRARGWLASRAGRVLDGPGEGRAIVRSLLLGEEEEESRDIERSFTRLGLSHLLAISGFHLTVMAGVALTLVRLTGDRGAWEGAIVAGLVVAYMLVVPAEAPIVRSGLMVLALLASRGLGRRYDDLNVLAWVGVALLAWRPMDLYSLGFQLSLGLTAALVWIVPRVNARVFEPPLRGAIVARPVMSILGRRVAQTLVATMVCWLLALPVIAHSTGTLSPWTVLATLPVSPLVLVLLWAGYTTLLVGVVVPGLGEACGAAIEPMGVALVWLVRVIDGLPGGVVFVPRVSLAWALGASALMVVWLGWGRVKSWKWWAAPISATVWLVIEVMATGGLERGVKARIDVLAVGDGMCAVVRSGDEALMWGCGASWASAGVREIPAAARAVGAHHVRRVILSGTEIDEFSAVLDVIEPLGVREVMVGPGFEAAAAREPAGAQAFVLGRLRMLGVEVRVVEQGERIELGESVLTVRVVAVEAEQAWGGVAREELFGRLEVMGEATTTAIEFVGEGSLGGVGKAAVVVGPSPRSGAVREATLGRTGAGVAAWSGRGMRGGGVSPAAATIGRLVEHSTERDGAVQIEVLEDGGVRSRVAEDRN